MDEMNKINWCHLSPLSGKLNTLRPRQNGRHLADDTFNSIFVNENVRILITFSLKFVPNGSINNIPALVQIMAWCRWGDKPLSEPMMVILPTHICVTRPQWVKTQLVRNLVYTLIECVSRNDCVLGRSLVAQKWPQFVVSNHCFVD